MYWLVSATASTDRSARRSTARPEMLAVTERLGLRRLHHHFLGAYLVHSSAPAPHRTSRSSRPAACSLEDPLFRNRAQVDLVARDRPPRSGRRRRCEGRAGHRPPLRPQRRGPLAAVRRARPSWRGRTADRPALAAALDELASCTRGFFGMNAFAESAAIHRSCADDPDEVAIPSFQRLVDAGRRRRRRRAGGVRLVEARRRRATRSPVSTTPRRSGSSAASSASRPAPSTPPVAWPAARRRRRRRQAVVRRRRGSPSAGDWRRSPGRCERRGSSSIRATRRSMLTASTRSRSSSSWPPDGRLARSPLPSASARAPWSPTSTRLAASSVRRRGCRRPRWSPGGADEAADRRSASSSERSGAVARRRHADRPGAGRAVLP